MSVKARKILIFMITLSAAILICGVVWSVVEGVRGAKFDKATATVTSCETQGSDGESFVVKALVTYEANGTVYTDVEYIGDLNRCKEGMQMRVYYLKSAPDGYVYSKSSDLGFALILLCGGALWLGITVAYIVCLYRSGYKFRNSADG